MKKMHRAGRKEQPPFGAQVAFARVATGLAWTGLGALAVGASAAGAVAIGALAIRALAVKRGRIQRFHHRLSERSIYLRFFAAKPQLSDMETGYFTNVDGMNRGRFLVLRHRFLHSSWCYQNRGSLSLIAITGGLLDDPS